MPPANPPPAPSPEDVQAAEALIGKCWCAAMRFPASRPCGSCAIAIALRDARAAGFRAGLERAARVARGLGLIRKPSLRNPNRHDWARAPDAADSIDAEIARREVRP